MSCVYDEEDPVSFPYAYFHPNGSLIRQGQPLSLPRYDSPVCVFETSSCLDSFREGQAGKQECCRPSAENPPNFIPIIIGLVGFEIIRINVTKCLRKKGDDVSYESPFVHFFKKDDGQLDGMRMCLVMVMVSLSIGASVLQGIIMPQQVQISLGPSQRSVQLAITSFITPVREIFAFLEDGMTVRVSYAIAAGRHEELNLLLHISVVGGICMGTLAFLIMMAIALSDAAHTILDPSSASNQRLIDQGCNLIPDPSSLLEQARSFWLLTTSVWIGGFMRKGVDGFMLGSGYLATYFAPAILSGLLPILVWFAGKSSTSNDGLSPLTLLGLAFGLDDWINAVALLLFIASARKLQRRYNLRLLLPWRRRGTDSSGDTIKSVVKKVIQESSELMLVDLAIQCAVAITIYLAASESSELAYKLSAPDAAYMILGPQSFIGHVLVFRTIGSMLVAQGRHNVYLVFYISTAILAVCMSIYSIMAAIIWREQFTSVYGQTACTFASSANCSQAYANIFLTPGGGTEASEHNLPGMFVAIGPVTAMRMVFMTSRVGLNTCHDFRFMSVFAVGAFFLGYLPMILISHFSWKSALGYYLSMNAVHFLLALGYTLRMITHVRKLARGEPGPWTPFMGKLEEGRRSSNAGGSDKGDISPVTSTAHQPSITISVKGSKRADLEAASTTIPQQIQECGVPLHAWKATCDKVSEFCHLNPFYDSPHLETAYWCFPLGPVQPFMCLLNPYTWSAVFAQDKAKKTLKADLNRILNQYGVTVEYITSCGDVTAFEFFCRVKASSTNAVSSDAIQWS